jgi:AmmeMemoRadiSam system protein B
MCGTFYLKTRVKDQAVLPRWDVGRKVMGKVERVFVFLIIFVQSVGIAVADDRGVRESPIAGSWYRGTKSGLTGQVDGFFEKVRDQRIEGRVLALVSPHAGYEWSGQAAAYGYSLIKGKDIRRVIILAPTHYVPYQGIAVSSYAYYKTPLGKVEVDRTVCDKLAKDPLFQGPREAEYREHSLEIQLPFLQQVLKTFKIVPLTVGEMKDEDYEKAAKGILPFVDGKTLLVASSDFTHYGRRFGYMPFTSNRKANLEQLDGKAIAFIVEKDAEGFLSYVKKTGATICGRRPIGIMLKMLPTGSKGRKLSYYTSGDLTGDFESSVSYASIAFTVMP